METASSANGISTIITISSTTAMSISRASHGRNSARHSSGTADGSEGERLDQAPCIPQLRVELFLRGNGSLRLPRGELRHPLRPQPSFCFSLSAEPFSCPSFGTATGKRPTASPCCRRFSGRRAPCRFNAVTIIVQRMTSLAGLGTIMALYFYVRARTAEGGAPAGDLPFFAQPLRFWPSDRKRMQRCCRSRSSCTTSC